jgi:hypothetical protein
MQVDLLNYWALVAAAAAAANVNLSERSFRNTRRVKSGWHLDRAIREQTINGQHMMLCQSFHFLLSFDLGLSG